jgi:hypothetical protein
MPVVAASIVVLHLASGYGALSAKSRHMRLCALDGLFYSGGDIACEDTRRTSLKEADQRQPGDRGGHHNFEKRKATLPAATSSITAREHFVTRSI